MPSEMTRAVTTTMPIIGDAERVDNDTDMHDDDEDADEERSC